MATIAELEQREKELAEAKEENSKVANQPIPQRSYGVKGITKEQQEAYIKRRNQAQANLAQIQADEQKLKEIRAQFEGYNAQVATYNKQKSDLEQARRAAARARAGGNPGRLNEQQREYFNAIQESKKVQLNKPDETILVEGIGGFSVAPVYQESFASKYVEQGYTVETPTMKFTPLKQPDTIDLPEGGYSVAKDKQEDFYSQKSLLANARQSPVLHSAGSDSRTTVLRGLYDRNSNLSVSGGNRTMVLGELPVSEVQAAPPRTKLQELRAKKGPFNIVLGLGGAFKEPFDFAFNLAKSPIKTVKDTAVGTYNFGKRIVTGEGYPEIGEALRNDPYYSTGYVGGQVALLKTPNLIVKGVDYARTYNLNKIPTNEVVAPEFFKGQTFPQIKKGQTAGELLAEFKTQLPGESKPAGFTASPIPFKKETTALKGSSEFPGVYQAPKLSPYFLRVSGEKEFKLFSLKFTDTLRPSATRITPNEYKLAPGIAASTSQIQPRKAGQIKRFFEQDATKGTAYITFIKTEKEAIIPFDTKLAMTAKRYYFDFEGRRVPIYEYKTAGIDKTLNKITAYKIYRSSYNNRIRRTGAINPYSSYLSASKSPISKLSSPYRLKSSSFKPLASQSKALKSARSSAYINKIAGKSSSITSRKSSMYTGLPRYSPGNTLYGYNAVRGNSNIYSNKINRRISDRLKSDSIKMNNLTKGFLTLIKRRGKFISLPGIRTKGEALRFGERAAKNTLGATFKVKATKKLVLGKQTSYRPSSNLFRDYRISKGKRVYTPDTFIQKRGKRLSFLGEIEEIQRSRKLKGGRRK